MGTATLSQYPYQTLAVDRVFEEFEQGMQSTLLVMATGTGKTLVSGWICERFRREKSRRALFLAHREELITQAANKMTTLGLVCAVEMADQDAQKGGALFDDADVVIATVQTLQRKRLASWPKNHFGLIITDEAHHSRAKSYRNIYQHFSEAHHLGVTATPDRSDQKNLGAVYQSLAFEYSLREAIKDEFLCPLTTARLHTTVNLRDIKTTGGDFNQGDLQTRIAPKIEALSDEVMKRAGNRPTVIFTPDVGSAAHFAKILSLMGMPSEYVCGQAGEWRISKEERHRRLTDFKHGKLHALVCCDLLIEGWDCPRVSCVVIARPTKSRSRYAQMVGRGTRVCEGKEDCLILDLDCETDTSSKQLVTAIDLFDDSSEDDEVMATAKELVERGEEPNLTRAIEEATWVQKQVKILLSGAKARVQREHVYDPVGVGEVIGLKARKGWDFDEANPATPQQLNYLRNLGLREPGKISKIGASRYIEKLVARKKKGLTSPGQIQYLANLGVSLDDARKMSFEDARGRIEELKADREKYQGAPSEVC